MAHKLFVGSLPYTVSNESLRQLFAEVGAVESAAVVTDRDTGRSRGFGFVEMATSEEADQAIAKFHGHTLEGRQLQVERAKASTNGGGSRGGFGRGGNQGGRW